MVQTFAVLPNGLGCGEVPAKAALNPVLGQTYRQTPFSAILAGEVLPNGSRIVMLSWRIKYDRSNSIRPIRPSVFLILARRQRLPEPARRIIAEIDTRGRVFAGARVPRLADAMRNICTQLGVERATPHDLRRSHGTMITALGFGRDAMNRIQNHKEGGIASVYDRHQYADENKRVMEAVAAKIMALVEGGPNNVLASRR
jgi:integrase